MKTRLAVILGVFALVAGGILATQYILQQQIPKTDPNFVREPVSGDDETKMKNGRPMRDASDI